MLHKDAVFQARMRVLLANPEDRFMKLELIVISRQSTLESDTTAMLERRFVQLHTFQKGSLAAARKGNWCSGAFDATQTSEEWVVWVPKRLSVSVQLEISQKLASLVFTRDGCVPLDPACPSFKEVCLGVTGQYYVDGGLVVATDGSVKQDGSMAAAACWSRPELVPFGFEVLGPSKSVTPELAGLAAAAERSPLDCPLTVLTDSRSSLLLLLGMQRTDFPVFLHRRTERPLLERVVRALNRRAEAGASTRLVKVKAHAGEPLNAWADLVATSSTGQILEETDLDPSTVYFYLHGRLATWGPRLRHHLCETAARRLHESLRRSHLSRDRDPGGPPTVDPMEDDEDLGANRPQMMNWTENWMDRMGMGRSVLGDSLRRLAIGARKRRILQTIGGTFPCQATLHTWGRADSVTCLLCNQAPENIAHVQCRCARLEAARTAAHHSIAQCLWAQILKYQQSREGDFHLSEETSVGHIRDLAPDRCASSWDRLWSHFFADPVANPLDPSPADLGRLRPDAVAIRWDQRRLFFLEVTRPFDARADFSRRADEAKLNRYKALVDRFNSVCQGWEAVTVPFTIGIRGSYDEEAWFARLTSLSIDARSIPRIMSKVVDATLAALDIVYDARKSILCGQAPPSA
jgi:hypothetical protein